VLQANPKSPNSSRPQSQTLREDKGVLTINKRSKHHPKPNKELIACILVDAALMTSASVCEKYNTSRTTLARYRKRLEFDSELAQLVTYKLEAIRPPPNMPTVQAVLNQAYQWLTNNIPKLHPSPEGVTAVAEAVKILRQQEMAERAISEYIKAVQEKHKPELLKQADAIGFN
jgi:hypothetical protein